MLTWRAPWWMYVVAGIYVFTLFFNARQEGWGPANAGWIPSWPAFRVVGVIPGWPMDKAGLQVGDILEAVDGKPLKGMPDWFLARAHFERDHPVELTIQRGEQHLRLRFAIDAPAWHTWQRENFLGVLAFYIARFILLLMAVIVAFSRPKQLSARLAALMLAIGSVAEGYPSSGWAAGLHHLPAALAIPVSLAVASCLLSPVVWLAFFTSFPQPRLSKRWRMALTIAPLVIFGLPIAASAIDIIYAPSVLAKSWPMVFSAPVSVIQDITGVVPLLFLSAVPFNSPIVQARFLEVWFMIAVLYFALGFLMLIVNYRRLDEPQKRRQVGMLCVAVGIFEVVTIHNILMRNWSSWFGTVPPVFFSGAASIGAITAFLFVPLTLAYCVLADKPFGQAR